MIGRDSALVVTSRDDAFHPPTSNDPSWIETLWFPFWVPEAGLSASVRVRLSPNVGLLEATVAGWKGESRTLFGDRITDELEGEPDLRDLRAGGLHIECLDALTLYRIRHQGPNSSLDIVFEAIMPPNPVAPEESRGMFAGHFEQPGRVTGELRFASHELAIDCHSIRDRSWGPRRMPSGLRLGNAHGTADGFGFFAYVNPTPEGIEEITSGYLLADGVSAAITGGLRETRPRDGMADGITIEAQDAAGRVLRAEGTCVNTMASNAGNGVYAVLNLVRWEHADRISWGENHDVWSEAAWLASGRNRL